MSIGPLSEETISVATQAFLDNPLTTQKLEWWLQHGHACERWFQFEWAFCLQQVLKTEFFVACEKDWADIVCFRRPVEEFPLWENKPSHAVEIKFYGNWWVDKSFGAAKVDLDKIEWIRKNKQSKEKRDYPAASFMFVLFVKTGQNSKVHEWIQKQVDDEHGVKGVTDFESALNASIEREPNVKTTHHGKPTDCLTSVQMRTYGYYNSAARAAAQ